MAGKKRLMSDAGKAILQALCSPCRGSVLGGRGAFEPINCLTVVVFALVALACFAEGNAFTGSAHTAWHKPDCAHIPDNDGLLSCAEGACVRLAG